jgi:hypothetical protein
MAISSLHEQFYFQEAVIDQRRLRREHVRQEKAARAIQRAYRMHCLRCRHSALVHVIRDVRSSALLPQAATLELSRP